MILRLVGPGHVAKQLNKIPTNKKHNLSKIISRRPSQWGNVIVINIKKQSKRSHQREKVDEEVSIATNDVESATTKVDELLESLPRLVTSVDHVRHVGRQYKWSAITDNINNAKLESNMHHLRGAMQYWQAPWAIIFYKIGTGEDVPSPQPHSKLDDCGFKYVGLQAPKSYFLA